MATTMRMKDKKMNKIHLDASGAMAISTVQAASDAASKGSNAQPASPLTAQETTGLSTGTQAATGGEAGTGNTLQGPAMMATSGGPMEAPGTEDTAEGPGEEPKAAATETAPLPPKLGETSPAPSMTLEAAKDPNAQKEATTVAPNTGSGTVVGETATK